METKWPFITELKPFLQAAWTKSGFDMPTAIQEKAAPAILEGRDVIAESPTGTGKTLAYLLPVLEKIDLEKQGLQAVILASSHELVMQIHQEIQKWGEGSGIRSAAFIGGANLKRQLEKLKKRPQLIAGTPGRLNELIKQKKLKMHEVKLVVLDEGDQLLVPEHIETVKTIIKSTMADRQLALFSATVNESISSIGPELMKDPLPIKIDKSEVVSGRVDHFYFVCEQREKIEILRKIAVLEGIKALAFVKDIGNLDVLAEKLQYRGKRLGVLHSDTKKEDRAAALKNIRTGDIPILLATDVAARGLDIQGLTHVVHYDLAANTTQYTHRSGRTGRAGAEGTVLSIVTEREERELKKIARELGIQLQRKTFYRGEMIDDTERARPNKPSSPPAARKGKPAVKKGKPAGKAGYKK